MWENRNKNRKEKPNGIKTKKERFKVSIIGILKGEIRGDKGNNQRNND